MRSISWSHIHRRFLPMYVLAAVIPFLLYQTVQFSAASGTDEVRVWTEPAAVQAVTNTPVQLTVYASYENRKKILPGLEIQFKPDASVAVSPQTITGHSPFGGTTIIGQVTVTPSTAGTVTVLPEVTIPPGAEVSEIIIKGSEMTVVQ